MLFMDMTRCPMCKKRLTATIDGMGRTDLRCSKCDKVDARKIVAGKRADMPLEFAAKASA